MNKIVILLLLNTYDEKILIKFFNNTTKYVLKTIFPCHVRNIMQVIHFVHYKDKYVLRKIPCKFFEDR